MSTFYLDYENGNDSNTGADWANAWKTITSGATAARIAPGDTIRIAKSPDPVSIGNGTWTDLSKTVTLATAQTATVDNCESAYTAGTNCTVTADTSVFKQGSKSCKIVTNASVTGAQKLAYFTISSTNFSAYQKLSFWVRFATTAPSDGLLEIRLCSDTAGDTTVDTFVINGVAGVGYFMPLTIAKSGGGNLGSAIQSIAIYTTGSYASKTLYFDNFITCATSGLNLQSLIGKNTGDDGWFPIQSIDGTTILIDNHTNCLGNAGLGYTGDSETVTTYIRETIKTTMAGATTTQVQIVQDSGGTEQFITFEGGYNTSSSTIDGETFFDGLNGLGYGIYNDSKNWISFLNINLVRYYRGYSAANSVYYNNITCHTLAGNTTYGILGHSYSGTASIKNVINNGDVGAYYQYYVGQKYYITNCNGNLNYGVYSVADHVSLFCTVCRNNNPYGIGAGNDINDFSISADTVSDNATNGIYFNNSKMYDTVVTSNSLQGVTNTPSSAQISSLPELKVFIKGGTSTTYTVWGTASSNTTTRHTASGYSWKLSPTTASCTSFTPLTFNVAKIACASSALVTVKAWLYRDNAGITGKLVCRGKQIAGVDSDVTATLSSTSAWEELTITFTPTEAGVVEIDAWAYGGTTYSVYVDDMTITQA